MSIKPIVFIAAGGKGSRLWTSFPELEASGLPKSVGLIVKEKPLIYYQLQVLSNLREVPIIVSFNNTKGANMFKNYVSEKTLPKLKYFVNVDSPCADPTTIDIIKSSLPNRIEAFEYDVLLVTSGDVYFDRGYLNKCMEILEGKKYNVQTLCKFKRYMATLETHYHPKYNEKNNLSIIKKSDELPNEIICHPQFLLKDTFKVYAKQPQNTSKSEFVNAALKKGHLFKILKPRQYVNLNFPQDYQKMLHFV